MTKDIAKVFPLPLGGDYVGKGRWKLTKPFEYINSPVIIRVPIGFITDGASIPKIAWSLIGSPWSGRYSRAAVIHDYGYSSQTITRKEVDTIFLDGMKILGVSWWKRKTMWFFVRSFAWKPWNNYKKNR